MVSPYIIRVRQVAHSAEPLLFGITAVGQSTLDLKLEVFDEENREYCVNSKCKDFIEFAIRILTNALQ